MEIDRAVLVGHSMGAHTAARAAIVAPERVAALVLGGPAHWGRPSENLERWDALAHGLETGGPAGMLAAYEPIRAPAESIDTIRTVILQRLARHEHPSAVADALRHTPRSAAFDGLEALRAIACPTLVVGTRDELDADHPLAVAEAYAEHIPGARLVVEDRGESPLTWRGSAMSRLVSEVVETM
jgi:pimeloyl-ACP methyl ester carboxylesterase